MTEEQIEAAYTTAMEACLQGAMFARGYKGFVTHDIVDQQRATAANGITALKTLYESYKALRADYAERLRTLAPSACIADAQKMGYLKGLEESAELCDIAATYVFSHDMDANYAFKHMATVLRDRGDDLKRGLAKTETVVQ